MCRFALRTRKACQCPLGNFDEDAGGHAPAWRMESHLTGGWDGRQRGRCLPAGISLHEVELSKNLKASLVKGEVVSPDGSEICT